MKTSWIPTSERLPKTSGNYLVTPVYGDVNILEFSIKHSAFNATDLQKYPVYAIAVKAWMPLPDPYAAN